ncbi:hypothetical protein [Phytohabitans houttuyneae]|uniref:hypothetical protein n=1 Tax=Phytohabitans houttuyneae TaxID=1076126 RepID=UPI001FE74DC0|nr:hypothetical protein [Phytohabitans houttuyneae]
MLTSKREQRGWTSRRKAARELHRIWKANLPAPPDLESLEKALYRHETGRAQVRDEAYRRLYCLAYDASPQELFGYMEHEANSDGETTIRSHKFITAFVGADSVEAVRCRLTPRQAEGQWLDCQVSDYPSPYGECKVYLWSFGAVIFHLVEELSPASLATLSVWRYRSYRENLGWATAEIRRILPAFQSEASYVLSAYWVQQAAWSGDKLDTALRILCMPKVLLDRNADSADALGHAELVERSLLDQGFSHPEMAPFGVKGISIGYASWSGVVYCPLAEQRCLTEEEVVAAELATQALWTYCAHINGEVEHGRDPAMPAEYGWRFLRAMRSRLVNPRPQETGQHRSMRAAILDTSGITNHLSQAIETVREVEEG